jgi:hypothetical protein
MNDLNDALNNLVEEGVISRWEDLGDRHLCYGPNGHPLRGLDIVSLALSYLRSHSQIVETKKS